MERSGRRASAAPRSATARRAFGDIRRRQNFFQALLHFRFQGERIQALEALAQFLALLASQIVRTTGSMASYCAGGPGFFRPLGGGKAPPKSLMAYLRS